MNMRSFPIDAFPGMSHDGDGISLRDLVPDTHPNGAQVRIKTVVWTSAKLVFDHDVPAVVRVGWNIVGVNHFACRDGVNHVQRFAVRVSLERPNVDPFVKAGIEDGRTESSRIADESVLPAFPWSTGFSLEITFDVLIKSRVIAAQQRMIFGRQDNVDRLAERRESEIEQRAVRPI